MLEALTLDRVNKCVTTVGKGATWLNPKPRIVKRVLDESKLKAWLFYQKDGNSSVSPKPEEKVTWHLCSLP